MKVMFCFFTIFIFSCGQVQRKLIDDSEILDNTSWYIDFQNGFSEYEIHIYSNNERLTSEVITTDYIDGFAYQHELSNDIDTVKIQSKHDTLEVIRQTGKRYYGISLNPENEFNLITQTFHFVYD